MSAACTRLRGGQRWRLGVLLCRHFCPLWTCACNAAPAKKYCPRSLFHNAIDHFQVIDQKRRVVIIMNRFTRRCLSAVTLDTSLGTHRFFTYVQTRLFFVLFVCRHTHDITFRLLRCVPVIRNVTLSIGSCCRHGRCGVPNQVAVEFVESCSDFCSLALVSHWMFVCFFNRK